MDDRVEAVIREVRAVAAELAADIDAAVAAEAPELAAAGRSRDRSAVVRAILTGLAERRLPTDAETETERRLGMLCADHGIPLEQVVTAYHLGFRQIWEKLLEYAGTPRPDGLLDLVDLLWSWLPILASAAADGYHQVSHLRRAGLRRDTAELVRLLATGQAGTEPCRALAHTVGFDPDGAFQVVSAPEPESAAALDDRLRSTAGVSRWVARAGRVLVISQDRPIDELLGVLGDLLGPAIGTSLVRPGLPGAAAALLDAEDALDLAAALGRPVDFRKDWLWITMLRHLDRLRPLLGAGRPADQPQLGAAARAYGDGGWSIAGAAENLGLHPNTVRYRLERLGQLANLDPRSIAGQRLSVLQDLVNEVDAARRRD